MVLVVSQFVKWRSPECSEWVLSDCSYGTPVCEGPVTDESSLLVTPSNSVKRF